MQDQKTKTIKNIHINGRMKFIQEEFLSVDRDRKVGLLSEYEYNKSLLDIITRLFSDFGSIQPYFRELEELAELQPWPTLKRDLIKNGQ